MEDGGGGFGGVEADEAGLDRGGDGGEKVGGNRAEWVVGGPGTRECIGSGDGVTYRREESGLDQPISLDHHLS